MEVLKKKKKCSWLFEVYTSAKVKICLSCQIFLMFGGDFSQLSRAHTFFISAYFSVHHMCVCARSSSTQLSRKTRRGSLFVLSVFAWQTSVSVCRRASVCFCQSLPVGALGSLAGRGTAVAVHYSEGDRGRSEFSGVCLRLWPLLNEEFSILLIMPRWLMSLSADSGECNKTLLLFGLFAFFNWAE